MKVIPRAITAMAAVITLESFKLVLSSASLKKRGLIMLSESSVADNIRMESAVEIIAAIAPVINNAPGRVEERHHYLRHYRLRVRKGVGTKYGNSYPPIASAPI